jgi:colanic acid biosynthesis glycosyl transferase WcaI
MLTDLAEHMASSGWRVAIIASDALHGAHGPRLRRRENRDGVDIYRVRTTRLTRFGLVGRAVDSITYFAGAITQLWRGQKTDIAAALTDPPLIVVPTVFMARARGMKCVYWAHDLFPQIAGELGVLRKNGPVYRCLLRVARAAMDRCDQIIVLGDHMARRAVDAGAPRSRTVVVHNWTDTALIRAIPRRAGHLGQFADLRDKFVVLYSGNIGRAHTFSAIIEAAFRLREDDDFVFLFIGRGPRRPELARAVRAGMTNIRLSDPVPRSQLAAALAVASVSLVTEDPRVAGLVVPSKAYGILASGRPLLFIGSRESDIATIVNQHKCGVALGPDDVDGLVDTLRRWRESPEECDLLGMRARDGAMEYDRSSATARWAASVEPLLMQH